VTVNPVPVASFTYTTQGGNFCKGRAIDFTDTSTNGPTSWSWDFGDGTTSTLQNPSHTYTTDGLFEVTLVSCNACGCSEPYSTVLQILPDCNTNCSANSHQIGCTGGTPFTFTGDTSADSDNYNTSYYSCQPNSNYSGPNFTYDLNFDSGANFIVTIEETVAEPNGYDLDLILSDACNPANCIAWGDARLVYDDHTPQNDDFFLIVDGKNGGAGPYRLTVTCLPPSQTGQCTAPSFSGIFEARDNDPCAANGILVTWPPAASWGNDRDGVPCASGTYDVRRAPASNPTQEICVASGLSGTSLVDLSAVQGVSYRYRVDAFNACCGEPIMTAVYDTAADAMDPQPVFAGLTSVTDPDPCARTGVNLTWPAASFGESSGTYRALRSTRVDCQAAETLASGLTSTSYTDSTGIPNVTYYYRVEAVNACGSATDGGTGCRPGTDFAGTGQEPSALDQNPAAQPLRIQKSGALMHVTWEDTGETYNVYRGSLGALRSGAYDHAAFGHCNVVGSSEDLAPGVGNYYFLVTASGCGGGAETSYGRDSAGQERPTAAEATGVMCP
jgi:hypothetical protein